MLGFHPQHSKNRYADGGPVRGPGSGTSDDIEKPVRQGSYIMPADSTEQIGDDALRRAGNGGARGFRPKGGKVDVHLSNGEFEIPPEQVHAIGVQALDAAKDATHTPVAGPMGFNPELFFANGGLVEDERKRPSAFGDAAAAASTPRTVQVATPSPAPAPQRVAAGPTMDNAFPGNRQPSPSPYASAPMGGPAPAPAPSPVDTDPQVRADRAAVGAAWDTAKGFNEKVGRGILDATTYPARVAANAYDQSVVRGMRAAGIDAAPLAPKLVPAGADPTSLTPFMDQQRSGAGLGFDPTAAQTAAPAAAPTVVAAAPAATRAAVPAAPAAQGAAATPVVTAVPAAAAPATAAEVAPGVFRSGNSYGDSPEAARGFRPGGAVSAQNMAAANTLAARSSTGGGLGFQPGGMSVIGNPGPDVAQAMFDGAAMRTAAARGAFSPRRGFSSDQGAIAAAALPVQTRAAADMEAGRQAAETQRADLGFRTQAQRDAIAAQQQAQLQTQRVAAEDRRAAESNAIRRDEVAGQNRVRDTQVAAAQDEASLRRTVLDPKASVADRTRAQTALLAIQGKSSPSEWGVQVTPAVKNADGSTTEGSVYRYNKQTGDVQRVDQSPQQWPVPNADAIASLKSNPKRAAEFESKFGPGSAKRAGVA